MVIECRTSWINGDGEKFHTLVVNYINDEYSVGDMARVGEEFDTRK